MSSRQTKKNQGMAAATANKRPPKKLTKKQTLNKTRWLLKHN